MSRRTVALVVLALVLAASPAASTAAQENGSIGIRLVDAPEERRDDPRAHIYIVDHVTQGTTITRHVELSSTAPDAKEISLYVGAAFLDDGEFSFEAGRAENELTDWSSIEPSSVSVPPNGTVQAEVTIAVPADAADGERYGVIWAELPGSGGSANQVNRVGVRIYLSVGEGEEPVTDFEIDTLTARRGGDGTPIIETTVTNTGGRAIDLSGTLSLSDGPGSLTAGPFNVDLGTTLGIGQSAPANVKLDKSVPDGPWTAKVTIESGRVKREATATITFPTEPGDAAEPVSASSSETQRKVLVPVAASVAGLVAAGGAAVLFGRRRATKLAAKV